MLEKSLTNNTDTLIYDLEDSVAPSQKEAARSSLIRFLRASQMINISSDLGTHNRFRIGLMLQSCRRPRNFLFV